MFLLHKAGEGVWFAARWLAVVPAGMEKKFLAAPRTAGSAFGSNGHLQRACPWSKLRTEQGYFEQYCLLMLNLASLASRTRNTPTSSSAVASDLLFSDTDDLLQRQLRIRCYTATLEPSYQRERKSVPLTVPLPVKKKTGYRFLICNPLI